MANNNVQNVKFLRNGALIGSREAARTALETNKALGLDGSAILARYSGGTVGDESFFIKTLVGFVYADNANTAVTIFDIDDAGADVEKKIKEINDKLGTGITSANTATAQFTALSGSSSSSSSADTSVWGAKIYASAYTNSVIDGLEVTDTAVPGQYVSQVSETDGKIAVVRADLPSASTVSGESKVVIDVTQDKGAITASAANLSGVKLDGYSEAATTGDISSTDTLGEALGKLQKTIHEMDKAASAANGQVVTTVSEANGVVSETKANVKDLQLGGYVKGEQSGAISGTDSINVALSKIENNIAASQSATTVTNTDHSINVTTAATGTTIGVNIKSGEKVISLGNDGIYTDIKLSAVTVSEANVKEAFALIASDGATQLGSTIKIYKDSSLLSVALLHADLSDSEHPVLPTYNKATNTWTDIVSPTEANQALCFAYENVSGDTVIAAVPVGSFINEQEFASGLTWDATAGKVIGVVDPASEPFLTVGEDGFKLAGVQGAIDGAIDALDVAVINPGAGKYIYAIEENGGKIAASGANVSEAALNNYSKGSDSDAVASTDTINQAISKLENQIDAAKSAATTVVAEGTDAGNNMSIAETAGADGHKIFTINLTDVASAQGLADEITHRKTIDGVNGDAYTADTNAHYISGASSLYGADQALDSALNTVDNAMLTGVTAGNGISVTNKSNKSQIISAVVNDDGGIINDGTGLHLGTIDCGTY